MRKYIQIRVCLVQMTTSWDDPHYWPMKLSGWDSQMTRAMTCFEHLEEDKEHPVLSEHLVGFVLKSVNNIAIFVHNTL